MCRHHDGFALATKLHILVERILNSSQHDLVHSRNDWSVTRLRIGSMAHTLQDKVFLSRSAATLEAILATAAAGDISLLIDYDTLTTKQTTVQ